MNIDKITHLSDSAEEMMITEVELQLWRIHYGFVRWQEECERVANADELSADEIAVLHAIRLQDRAKTIADLGRLLNRDNFFSINYNINKLLKLGLIAKVDSSKKQHQYTVTEKGKANSEAYALIRRKILMGEFSREVQHLNLEETKNTLVRLKNIYEEAIRVAASYKSNYS